MILFTPFKVAKGPKGSERLASVRHTEGIDTMGRKFNILDDWTNPDLCHRHLEVAPDDGDLWRARDEIKDHQPILHAPGRSAECVSVTASGDRSRACFGARLAISPLANSGLAGLQRMLTQLPGNPGSMGAHPPLDESSKLGATLFPRASAAGGSGEAAALHSPLDVGCLGLNLFVRRG